MLRVVAKVRYISQTPVTRWKNPSAFSPGLLEAGIRAAPTLSVLVGPTLVVGAPFVEGGGMCRAPMRKLAKNSLTYTPVSPAKRIPTGQPPAAKNTTAPRTEMMTNAI